MARPGLIYFSKLRPFVGGDVETQHLVGLLLRVGRPPDDNKTVPVLLHAVARQGERHARHVGPCPGVVRVVGLHCVNNSLGRVTSRHVKVSESADSRSLKTVFTQAWYPGNLT